MGPHFRRIFKAHAKWIHVNRIRVKGGLPIGAYSKHGNWELGRTDSNSVFEKVSKVLYDQEFKGNKK